MFHDVNSSPLDLRSKARRILDTFGWIEGARYIRNHKSHTVTEKAVLLRIRPVSARFQVFSACQFQGMSSSMRLIL